MVDRMADLHERCSPAWTYLHPHYQPSLFACGSQKFFIMVPYSFDQISTLAFMWMAIYPFTCIVQYRRKGMLDMLSWLKSAGENMPLVFQRSIVSISTAFIAKTLITSISRHVPLQCTPFSPPLSPLLSLPSSSLSLIQNSKDQSSTIDHLTTH